MYSIFFKKAQNHEFAVGFAMDALCENDFFKEYHTACLINRLSKPFVLSNYGVVIHLVDGRIHFTLPVSPCIAITLYDFEKKLNRAESMLPNVFRLQKYEHIDFINMQSVKQQIKLGWGYICSNDSAILKTYINAYNFSTQPNTR